MLLTKTVKRIQLKLHSIHGEYVETLDSWPELFQSGSERQCFINHIYVLLVIARDPVCYLCPYMAFFQLKRA